MYINQTIQTALDASLDGKGLAFSCLCLCLRPFHSSQVALTSGSEIQSKQSENLHEMSISITIPYTSHQQKR